MRHNHGLGECPYGVEWCETGEHMCEDCLADDTDYWMHFAQEEQRDFPKE